MRRYVQAETVSRFTALQRTQALDLAYVGYGLFVVALVLASYLIGAIGWLPHDPRAIDVALINAAPFTPGHLLGTDFLGRDLQARLILGIQAYFLPGLLAITISVAGGSVLGILAGYRGGWADTIITYFDNLLDSFPRLVLILLVIAAFKPDIYYVMVVVGITSMPVIANLVAGKIAFLRQKSFIEAAHALGLPAHTVILKHILWFNCRALLVIQAT
ncbi:MAG: ABC transporter permease, partial [Burkholderiales bacterium]